MSKVSLSGIRKSYGELEVLHGIDLEVTEGEFVVLVGPSGCGKSTLLRMIAGLDSVTAGVLRIDGRVVNDVEARERDIAMVFQSYALYPHMSVAENIGFPLRVKGVEPKDASERISRTADMIRLSHLLDRKPRQLSGGQRQQPRLWLREQARTFSPMLRKGSRQGAPNSMFHHRTNRITQPYLVSVRPGVCQITCASCHRIKVRNASPMRRT